MLKRGNYRKFENFRKNRKNLAGKKYLKKQGSLHFVQGLIPKGFITEKKTNWDKLRNCPNLKNRPKLYRIDLYLNDLRFASKINFGPNSDPLLFWQNYQLFKINFWPNSNSVRLSDIICLKIRFDQHLKNDTIFFGSFSSNFGIFIFSKNLWKKISQNFDPWGNLVVFLGFFRVSKDSLKYQGNRRLLITVEILLIVDKIAKSQNYKKNQKIEEKKFRGKTGGYFESCLKCLKNLTRDY